MAKRWPWDGSAGLSTQAVHMQDEGTISRDRNRSCLWRGLMDASNLSNLGASWVSSSFLFFVCCFFFFFSFSFLVILLLPPSVNQTLGRDAMRCDASCCVAFTCSVWGAPSVSPWVGFRCIFSYPHRVMLSLGEICSRRASLPQVELAVHPKRHIVDDPSSRSRQLRVSLIVSLSCLPLSWRGMAKKRLEPTRNK